MILAVDTSTKFVGLAVYDGSQVLCEEIWLSRRFHTTELAPAVERNLSRLKLSGTDLDVLAVAAGPGSFTGLRIGMAFVKGLAFSHQLPVIGIPTLDITASGYPPADIPLTAVLEAGRGRFAAAQYEYQDERWRGVGEVKNLDQNELLETLPAESILTGEITEELRDAVDREQDIMIATPGQTIRSPRMLALLAWEQWQDGNVDDPNTLIPYYLHKGDPIPG
jgi:tRNA threonylcarbamoyladenosine biosynthesis protein TsaB